MGNKAASRTKSGQSSTPRIGARWWSIAFGLLTIVIHGPFVFHYENYFQSGTAIPYLQAKRILVGDVSLYLWGTDYIGSGPIDFLTAALFKIFGASIPLAGFVSLLCWGIGVSLLVGYTAICFGRAAAICSGCALAIGVPFFLQYCTQPFGSTYNQTPLFVGGFLWLATLMVRRGPQTWLSVVTGFIMGWFWYAWKQPLVVWLSIAIAFLLLPQGRAFLRGFVRSRMAVLALVAFLIGYSPELLYKMGFIGDRTQRISDSSAFLGLASGELILRNWYFVFRCIAAYFDADPWSRSVEGVHYLNHLENWESFPLNPVDTIGIIAAFIVIAFILRVAARAYRSKNLNVFMLAVCPLVNIVVVMLASKSGGAYYAIRRYIMPAGVLFLLWLGVKMSRDLARRKWIVPGLFTLLLGISFYHQCQLLAEPDELSDYKATVADIEKSSYSYGLSWYSFSHTLTALSNERVVFGLIDDGACPLQNPYQTAVLTQQVVALVWPATTAPPFPFMQKLFFGGVRIKDDTIREVPEVLAVAGQKYQRVGSVKRHGELSWAPYQRAPGMVTK